MRVLITRARADAERSARQLATRGHEAVIAPVFEIAPTNEPAPPGPFDGVIVTSAQAIPALAARHRDARVPVFAVGERTATAAAAAGVGDVRTASGDALALAVLIKHALERPARLLHVAGRDHKAEPAASLVAAGFDVVPWIAYHAAAIPDLPEEARRALRDARLDAALHYSRRSAALLLDRVSEAGLIAPFLLLAHVCLSDDAAFPLRSAGAPRVTVAERPDEAALFTALDGCMTNADLSRSVQSRC
jgi:uroporphyrinogen-III synthase